MFTYSDPDGTPAQTYAFWVSANASGHFVLNGVAQPDGTTVTISASQLSELSYDVGSSADQIYIRANNGENWSTTAATWTNFTLTPITDTPVVTVANMTANEGSLVAASSMFTYSDPDGTPAQTYAFWVSASSSGHFVLNGVAQPDGTTVTISASQLSELSYDVGSSADQIYIRAYNGENWSSPAALWTNFTLTPTTTGELSSMDDGVSQDSFWPAQQNNAGGYGWDDNGLIGSISGAPSAWWSDAGRADWLASDFAPYQSAADVVAASGNLSSFAPRDVEPAPAALTGAMLSPPSSPSPVGSGNAGQSAGAGASQFASLPNIMELMSGPSSSTAPAAQLTFSDPAMGTSGSPILALSTLQHVG
jgi:hypothetical protein